MAKKYECERCGKKVSKRHKVDDIVDRFQIKTKLVCAPCKGKIETGNLDFRN